MTPEEAKKFYKRALASARRHGCGESSEDYAQEVLLRLVEGRGQHQTIDQHVIDVHRGIVGRRGSSQYQLRRNIARADIGVDALENRAVDPVDTRDELDLERYRAIFKGTLGFIFDLSFLDERSGAEIAALLGVTESRISRQVSFIRSQLHAMIAAEQVKERMEWDESFGCYSIDWIRI